MIAKNALEGKVTTDSQLAQAVADPPYLKHLNELLTKYSAAGGQSSEKGYLKIIKVHPEGPSMYMALDNRDLKIWAVEIVSLWWPCSLVIVNEHSFFIWFRSRVFPESTMNCLQPIWKVLSTQLARAKSVRSSLWLTVTMNQPRSVLQSTSPIMSLQPIWRLRLSPKIILQTTSRNFPANFSTPLVSKRVKSDALDCSLSSLQSHSPSKTTIPPPSSFEAPTPASFQTIPKVTNAINHQVTLHDYLTFAQVPDDIFDSVLAILKS